MATQNLTSFTYFVHVVIFVLTLVVNSPLRAWAEPGPIPKAPNNSISAIFVFGDSTSDPGNNNYIRTPFKSNFAPYGRDFPNHVATGRFSNGLLSTDYIARYVGVKELIPPYLNASLSVEELMSGVSFASAGSGYDPLTPQLSGVIAMSRQLEYFKEYRSRIEGIIGVEKTNVLINKSVFIVSAGTNDFVVNYYTMPIRRRMYTLPQYQQFLVQNVHDFIKSLWDQGARKIAVAGVPPMGCLPVVITMKANSSISNRSCVESLSVVARDYNELLQTQLISLQLDLADRATKIVYIDIYSVLHDIIQGRHDHSTYNFEDISSGCCGTGYLEAAYLCNAVVSSVCSDASKYVFWDSIHPTEMTYYLLFMDVMPVINFIIKD
ncbi:GDSL esterase/lipase At5g45960-like [Silene latifolia]|uniref:GDSL esterase/lipase At5g45960-like n=1 Tax=Silene latifolia TaxID=37657 RepID=UPI003D76E8FA